MPFPEWPYLQDWYDHDGSRQRTHPTSGKSTELRVSPTAIAVRLGKCATHIVYISGLIVEEKHIEGSKKALELNFIYWHCLWRAWYQHVGALKDGHLVPFCNCD